MKKTRWFKTGLCLALSVLIFAGAASAKTGKASVDITCRDITLYRDGTQLEPRDPNGAPVEPFILSGSVYLPLRAVGEAVGYEVAWNGKTNTVTLREKTSVPLQTRDTYASPVQPGESYTTMYNINSHRAYLRMTLLEALRGGEVTSRFPEASKSLRSLPSGTELFAVKLKVEFLEGEGLYRRGIAYYLGSEQFVCYAGGRDIYPCNLGITSAETFNLSLKPGASMESYIFYAVNTGASDLKIVYQWIEKVWFDTGK